MTLYSVSEDLLCAFELLKPLDGAALRKEMTKAKRKRCALPLYLSPWIWYLQIFNSMLTAP